MTTAIALAVAASASAEVFQFDEHDPAVTQTFDCGAMLTFTTDVNGRFIVNGNDDFVRVVEQFTFTGTINYQGRTFRANDHQTGTTFVSRDDVLKRAQRAGPVHGLSGSGSRLRRRPSRLR